MLQSDRLAEGSRNHSAMYEQIVEEVGVRRCLEHAVHRVRHRDGGARVMRGATGRRARKGRRVKLPPRPRTTGRSTTLPPSQARASAWSPSAADASSLRHVLLNACYKAENSDISLFYRR